jgi:hypothetical protein
VIRGLSFAIDQVDTQFQGEINSAINQARQDAINKVKGAQTNALAISQEGIKKILGNGAAK